MPHFCKFGKICRAKFKVWPLMKISLYTATLLQDLSQNFGLIKFNLAKVLQYKVTLNPKKAHGCGNISIKMIQICSETITAYLRMIFAESL